MEERERDEKEEEEEVVEEVEDARFVSFHPPLAVPSLSSFLLCFQQVFPHPSRLCSLFFFILII